MTTFGKLIGLVMALGIVLGLGMASLDGGEDLATSNLVANVAGNMFTVANLGTGPSVDIGGARIMVGNTLLGRLPYRVVLGPNPFKYVTADDQPLTYDWKIVVPITGNISSGDVIRVTNGVGVYAKVKVE